MGPRHLTRNVHNEIENYRSLITGDAGCGLHGGGTLAGPLWTYGPCRLRVKKSVVGNDICAGGESVACKSRQAKGGEKTIVERNVEALRKILKCVVYI